MAYTYYGTNSLTDRLLQADGILQWHVLGVIAVTKYVKRARSRDWHG